MSPRSPRSDSASRVSPSASTASSSAARGPSAPKGSSARVLRRTIAIIIVVAFSLAAAGGIFVLLGDIESEATFQVVATTALTGAVSVAAFCGATLLGRRAQWFGIVTIASAVVTMALCLWFLWGDPYQWGGPWSETDGMSIGDIISRVLASSVLFTAVAAVSALILLLTSRTWLVRIGLPITLVLLAFGTALVLVLIWVELAWENEWLTRVNGIVWILAALGVVIVPLTSLLLRSGRKPAELETTAPGIAESTSADAPAEDDVSASPTPSATAFDRLEAAARAEGVTADELLDRLLASDVGASGSPEVSQTSGSPEDTASHPRH